MWSKRSSRESFQITLKEQDWGLLVAAEPHKHQKWRKENFPIKGVKVSTGWGDSHCFFLALMDSFHLTVDLRAVMVSMWQHEVKKKKTTSIIDGGSKGSPWNSAYAGEYLRREVFDNYLIRNIWQLAAILLESLLRNAPMALIINNIPKTENWTKSETNAQDSDWPVMNIHVRQIWIQPKGFENGTDLETKTQRWLVGPCSLNPTRFTACWNKNINIFHRI